MRYLIVAILFLVACAKSNVETLVVPGEDHYFYVTWQDSVGSCNGLGGTVSYGGTDLNRNDELDDNERENVVITCDHPEVEVPGESEHHDNNGNHYGCMKKDKDHRCRKKNND